MGHPLIQVVDENDQPLFGMTRDQAWAEGQFHRISRILLFDDNGRLLIQKRAVNMVVSPGKWDCSAAGHVDEGEDYETAAHREMYEEIGVKTELEEVSYYPTEETINGFLVKRFNKSYKGVINFTPDNLDYAEVSAVRWISLTDLKTDNANNPEEYSKGLIYALEKINK